MSEDNWGVNDWMRQANEQPQSILDIAKEYPDANNPRDKTFFQWALDNLLIVKCGSEAETKDVGRGWQESTGRVAVLILFERPKPAASPSPGAASEPPAVPDSRPDVELDATGPGDAFLDPSTEPGNPWGDDR